MWKGNIIIYGNYFFDFYSTQDLVILLNCFIKKSNKTPKNEIEKGIKLKEAYFKEKTIKEWNEKVNIHLKNI